MLNICSEKMNDDGKPYNQKDRKKNNSCPHGRSPCFILMEFRKLCGLSYESFFTNLFPELVAMKKPDIRRYKEKSEEEREEEIDKEKAQISHNKLGLVVSYFDIFFMNMKKIW